MSFYEASDAPSRARVPPPSLVSRSYSLETAVPATTKTVLLFCSKAETFWNSAITECHRDPRKLWCIIGQLLQQQNSQHVHHYSAAEIAAHFTSKVDSVRAATSNAPAPVINSRRTTALSRLDELALDKASKLSHCRSTVSSTRHRRGC